MRVALELMQQATTNLTHKKDADYVFHIAIARACNNPYFEATMGALREHIYVGMKMHGLSLMDDAGLNLEHVFKEHDDIYDAIKRKDAKAARTLMIAHIEHSRGHLFEGWLLDLSL